MDQPCRVGFREGGTNLPQEIDDAAGIEQALGREPSPELANMVAEDCQRMLDRLDDVARCTQTLITDLPSLDASHPLPEAPWFEPGARWSARRVLLHILAETAQHAGHADIIRESIDGAKTMG